MSVIPDKKLEKVQFFEEHNAPWTANATAIGLVSGDVTSLNTKTVAARAAFNTQQAAQLAAKSATQNYSDAVNTMVLFGATLITKIKSKAATDGNSVYTLAQIPVPAAPTPVGPPGTPTDFVATLNPDGSLKLKWKCANPANATGTTYQMYRKAGGQADFTFIGGTGTRSFLDETVASNSTPITYQIVAQRSTASGTPAQFIVNFGVAGTGEMTASVVSVGGAPRMAA